jgi:uncharacterized Zn finger protein
MVSRSDKIADELKDITFAQVQRLDEESTDGRSFEFYERSQVTKATVYANHLSGVVGNYVESFEAQITAHGNEISGSCTCGRTGKICKHVITLLYAWVNDGSEFLNVEHVLSEVKGMEKKRLVEIVSNIIRHEPRYVDLFLATTNPEWDEIDIDPDF